MTDPNQPRRERVIKEDDQRERPSIAEKPPKQDTTSPTSQPKPTPKDLNG
jgi:hypothetical protein